jgi:D-alanine--poly(phosphoribitol) ligase subunit 2
MGRAWWRRPGIVQPRRAAKIRVHHLLDARRDAGFFKPMPEAPITPAAVIELLTAENILEPQEPITPDTDLFTLGLDSMAMMQLLLQIEERFRLTVQPAEMTRERFATAGALASFLGEKRRLAA